MSLVFRDFPLCTAPRLRPLFAPSQSEIWVAGDGSLLERSPRTSGCPTCPGDSGCAGVPVDYAERFGWEELTDPGDLEIRVRENVEQQQAPAADRPDGLRLALAAPSALRLLRRRTSPRSKQARGARRTSRLASSGRDWSKRRVTARRFSAWSVPICSPIRRRRSCCTMRCDSFLRSRSPAKPARWSIGRIWTCVGSRSFADSMRCCTDPTLLRTTPTAGSRGRLRRPCGRSSVCGTTPASM